MVAMSRNAFLDDGVSDISYSGHSSDSDRDRRTKVGTNSTSRNVKRRKLSHSSVESDDDPQDDENEPADTSRLTDVDPSPSQPSSPEHSPAIRNPKSTITPVQDRSKSKPKREGKPGIIYLSSLPPYLKPSALRNILAQKGFEPITRLFLAPTSKHKHSSKKSSRQLYSEGWIEFSSHKTAKQCAQALNAQQVGGKKGGFYYDDIWNMKYLRGMSWEELMSGIREEKREEEGRADEERRRVRDETRFFVEGVERGKKMQGMKRKRREKGIVDGPDAGDGENEQRTWRQYEPAQKQGKDAELDRKSRDVLAQIF